MLKGEIAHHEHFLHLRQYFVSASGKELKVMVILFPYNETLDLLNTPIRIQLLYRSSCDWFIRLLHVVNLAFRAFIVDIKTLYMKHSLWCLWQQENFWQHCGYIWENVHCYFNFESEFFICYVHIIMNPLDADEP